MVIPLSPPEHAPRHPGRILEEDFLPSCPQLREDTQEEIARRLGMSRRRLNELLNERRSVTPDTALRLARLFGTKPEYWLHAQAAWDIYEAQHSSSIMRSVRRIEPVAPLGGGARREEPAQDEMPSSRPAPARNGVPPDVHLEEVVERAVAAKEEAHYFREYLGRQGLLPEAERFARIRREVDRLDPRSKQRERVLRAAVTIPDPRLLHVPVG